MNDAPRHDGTPPQTTPLGALLALSSLSSLGTGIFWNVSPFIAKQTYHFSETRTIALYVLTGALYTVGAFNSGRAMRVASRWLSTRGVLIAVCVAQTAAGLLPFCFRGEWALWASVAGVNMMSSLVWPVVESYLTAGRHGADMRRAIGWFNLIWAPSVAVPLFALAPLVKEHGEWAFAGFAGANLLVVACLRWFPPDPGRHDPEAAGTHIGPEYDLLLRCARYLLPLSYVLIAAINPILPYRLTDLQLPVPWQTPAAATWHVVRVVVFAAMWALPFWHGRWSVLLFGASSIIGGFILVILAPRLGLVLLGLGLMGAGLGAIYYATLYYAMSVGHAAVDAGGVFEGLIGAGYAIGPLAGLLGAGLGGRLAIVGAVTVILAVGGLPAVRPYLHARRRRSMLAAR